MNEPRDVPPEELEFPLGKMTAEGITRFRNNEKKMEEVVTLEEYVRDLEFKAREEGEAKAQKEVAKAREKVAKEKARADAAEAKADAAEALVAELQAQIAALKAAAANP